MATVLVGFIVLLVAVLSVNANTSEEIAAIIANVTGEISRLNETQLKQRSKVNVDKVITLMKDASVQYKKEDLSEVAEVYEVVETFLSDGLQRIFVALNEQDVHNRTVNLIKLTVISEVLQKAGQMERDKRAQRGGIVVNDTAENLDKKYQAIIKKNLDLLNWTVIELKARHSDFWAEVHQVIFDFMSQGFPLIAADLKNLTEPVRAKNLQLLIDDLTLVYEVSNTRTEGTYYQKITETVSEYATLVKEKTVNFVSSVKDSIKSTFSKWF